jgi:hypothetical protein
MSASWARTVSTMIAPGPTTFEVTPDPASSRASDAAGERSELLLSVIAGIWLIRKVIATPALAAAEPGAQLEELFGLLTGEIRPNR